MSNILSEIKVGTERVSRLDDGAVEFRSANAGNLVKRVRNPDVSDLYAALAAVAPTLTSIAAVITDDTLTHPRSSQITVTGTYSDASTADLTASCQFSTADATKATVSTSGLVTSVAAGAVSITAVYRGFLSSVEVVTVS